MVRKLIYTLLTNAISNNHLQPMINWICLAVQNIIKGLSMKLLLAAILALSLVPFASFAGEVETEDQVGRHVISIDSNKDRAKKDETRDEEGEDGYPSEGNDGKR